MVGMRRERGSVGWLLILSLKKSSNSFDMEEMELSSFIFKFYVSSAAGWAIQRRIEVDLKRS